MNGRSSAAESLDLSGCVLFATGPSFVVIKRLTEGEPITIGRSRSADVCVPDPRVSREHAVVSADRTREGWRLRVRDLDSCNGTLLGLRALAPEVDVDIVPGQPISIGATTLVIEA